VSRAPRHPTSGALRGLAFIALLAALAGCATQPPAHSGRATGGLPPPPNAAGAVVGEFQMADGRVGYLYMNGRRYSLAVPGYRTTLPVHGSPARIRSSEAVGGRTVVLLEVSNPGCDNELVVGVLRGNEVLSWTIGDCRNSPAITVDADRITFDYPAGATRTTRFIYEDGRLQRTEVALAPQSPTPTAARRPPTMPSALSEPAGGGARPSRTAPMAAPTLPARSARTTSSDESASGVVTGPRYVPGVPSSAGTPAEAREPAVTAAPASRAARAAAAPQPTPVSAPRELVFPKQEQKPVRIVLDQ